MKKKYYNNEKNKINVLSYFFFLHYIYLHEKIVDTY